MSIWCFDERFNELEKFLKIAHEDFNFLAKSCDLAFGKESYSNDSQLENSGAERVCAEESSSATVIPIEDWVNMDCKISKGETMSLPVIQEASLGTKKWRFKKCDLLGPSTEEETHACYAAVPLHLRDDDDRSTTLTTQVGVVLPGRNTNLLAASETVHF
eukprot:Gregarina_sp_Poly_1__4650@NODE_2485_length_2067_cov_219_457000_g1577_i0_p2_GENE_NODE_2485_length_2067_cov_219_457000_g1577_i0NODE_2485_length_2067_cov_219_457000_g1577_i0_p2_ORF_typecomplete_len160_score24_50_NODE_2485_length_2067_cov_219_457000_g1577_i010101489